MRLDRLTQQQHLPPGGLLVLGSARELYAIASPLSRSQEQDCKLAKSLATGNWEAWVIIYVLFL